MNAFEFIIATISIVGPLYYLRYNSPEQKKVAARRRMQERHSDLQIKLILRAHFLSEHRRNHLTDEVLLNLRRQLHNIEVEAMIGGIRLVDVPGVENVLEIFQSANKNL